MGYKKRYPDFYDINPYWNDWVPPRVRNDPDPNPPFRIGYPERQSSKGESFEYHKRNGTLGVFRDMYRE